MSINFDSKDSVHFIARSQTGINFGYTSIMF